MKQKDFDLKGTSRLDHRAKRRKTNLILNSLIVIVILLIVIVSYSIFFGNGEKASTTAVDASNQAQENKEESNKVDDSEDSSTNEKNKDTEGNPDTENNSEDAEDTDSGENETDTTVEEPESDPIVSEGGADPNVKNTITNPDWQPVGTTQSGEHVPVYDSAHVDWKEMEKAISYGTGLSQSDMTVWFLGRNKDGAENQSVATVSTKDNSVTYRVFIEWVDGQGWKPIKIEELIQNDRR